MVNKQYNVQNLSKSKTKNSDHIDTELLKQSITVIPNETHVNDTYQLQNAFERNITQQYYHNLNDSLDLVDGHIDSKHMTGDDSMADIDIVKNSIAATTDNDSQSQKQLTIDDIGRFQYILQMDREMVRACSNSIVNSTILFATESHSNRKLELPLRYNLGSINKYIMNNFAAAIIYKLI